MTFCGTNAYRKISIVLAVIIIASVIYLPASLSNVARTASGVKLIRGPTLIPEGDGTSEQDLTLMNEYIAVTIAVGSTPPWGVPKGAILDGAPIKDGEILQDVLAQFSFPVNGWGNWAHYTTIEVVENSSDVAVVRAVGYWKDIKVETTYRLEAGKDYLIIETVLTNEGSKPYTDLTSGYAMSLRRGWTFTPGFGTGLHYSADPKESVGAFDDWTSGYGEDFAVGVWAPYYTHLSTSTSWVDPFTKHDLQPGESKTFTAYLIMKPVGDTNAILEEIMELKGISFGAVEGSVASSTGESVNNPIVIVEKDGKPYCWTIGSDGKYRLSLPEGTYSIHAEAKNYGPSSPVEVSVSPGATVTTDLTDVTLPGKVIIDVFREDTNEPLDAKILVSGGPQTVIRYLSISTVYTDFDNQGHAEIPLAPGTYTITVSHGGGFISKPVTFENVKVTSGAEVTLQAPIQILIEPSTMNWYSADLHHHSNILDGRTPPEYLVLAQSAAGLDFVFVSDHDSVANHEIIAQLAQQRGLPFIPSVEISPAWAHFNPYPITLGEDLTYRGTIQELFESAREHGAIVIRVNHPYTTSGYFKALAMNEVPGGYDPGWDVAEVNGKWGSSDNQTVRYLMSLWDEGLQYYVTAGSDTHDVWATPYTGYPRVYAYIPGDPTPEAFALAEKNGHTFISYGPLIFTDPLPGYTIAVGEDGTVTIKARVFAVDGISRIAVLGKGGKLLFSETYDDTPMEKTVEVTINAEELFGNKDIAWVSVLAWDADKDLAMTNPIWISKSVVKAVEYVTETQTVTSTQTTSVTVTETATQEVAVETVKWDITAGVAILALLVGIAVGYVALKKK